MKKYALSLLRSSVCAFAVIFSASAALAQDAPAKKIKDHRTAPELFFLQEGDVPNSFMLLPAPPDGASITFLNDQARYNWGKTMRNTPRGEQAFKDAHVEGNGVPQAFSEAFGVEINEETPEILKLVVGMREDAGDSAHARPRTTTTVSAPSLSTRKIPATPSSRPNSQPTAPIPRAIHQSAGPQRLCSLKSTPSARTRFSNAAMRWARAV